MQRTEADCTLCLETRMAIFILSVSSSFFWGLISKTSQGEPCNGVVRHKSGSVGHEGKHGAHCPRCLNLDYMKSYC